MTGSSTTAAAVVLGNGGISERMVAFYKHVDDGNIDSLVTFFSDDSTYHRPGYEPYTGRAGLTRFYSSERKIRSGLHSLDTIVVQDNQVAVRGDFSGTLHDGEDVRLRFSDFFEIDREGLFRRRETFFFAALA